MKSVVSEPLNTTPMDALTLLRGVVPGNAFGLFTAAPDSEYLQTLSQIGHTLPFPVVGGTILANPFDNVEKPFLENLAVAAKEGLRVAVALSDVIDHGKAREQMHDLYTKALDELGTGAKMFLLYTPMFPNLFIDDFLDELFALAGSIPVFGGMMSDDFRSEQSAVFAHGRAYTDRVVLVALGGDIRPVFGIGKQITVLSEFSPIITEAHDNVIVRVDDMSFATFMDKIGFGPDALEDFPLSVRVCPADTESEALPNIHAIVALDAESGAGTLDSSVRAGSSISLGYLAKQDIVDSTLHCLDQLREGMRREEAKGYTFSFVLAVSCVARYYTALGQGSFEAEMLNGRLPGHLERSGFFGFAEICPTISEDGRVHNGKHGQTLGLCAF